MWPNLIKTVKGGSWDTCTDNARGFLFGLGDDEGEWLEDDGRVIYSATGDNNLGWCYTSVGRTPVNDGKWHHIAATSSQAQDRTIIYVDGQIDATDIYIPMENHPGGLTVDIGGGFNG